MFSSVNASLRLAAARVVERGLLALRWPLEVARGYQAGAISRDGVHEHLRTAAGAAQGKASRFVELYADAALDVLRVLNEQRAAPGPLGVGARLACTPAEFVALRVTAENLRCEALRHEQQDTGARA